ncbi:MAG: 4-(cytidine 5'-diphospho)-2-C-methyl-D-erythritol kinase [Alistipes sp.]|nr:4-(cytidine 5'-diphospho)-2-C-methyl-D-erythritol kinase [Candidatus Alistipes equi]
MIFKANAKFNLGLSVLSKREDGYHNLETVMVPLYNLYDTIQIERHSSGLSFTQSGIQIDCPLEKNLCYKAYEVFRNEFSIPGAKIHLHKQVPFGAGLGAGSSDATHVLKGLNEIYGTALSSEELIELASRLGSDTAFFVKNSPVLCTSRGEVMEDIQVDALKGKWILLVKPPFAVSTKEAYMGVPLTPNASHLRDILSYPEEKWRDMLKNSFETNVFQLYPQLAQIKNDLYTMGALYASMSGSGSSLYGIFSKEPSSDLFSGMFLHKEIL